ncbi:beta family protein [Paracoccus versutus]|uniref:T4 beta protein n=1 Tax=Paracoccus versutus TaxID=34007 RepID=A0A3D9XIK6_PARVE|nr:hypothetical protein [Paracoccus versutus]REF70264.1 T4 beta protein [Paracoccus versutus]WGR57418.1 hypothetical protein E3U25_15610 [Paracoccus versutus]
MTGKYYLVLKTGTSEMRAYRNITASVRSEITPIIEITRGRKNQPKTRERTGEQYNFSAIQDFIDNEVSKSRDSFIDVTRDDDLSSDFTRNLSSPKSGYICWAEYIRERQRANPSICPILQISPVPGESWIDYERSLFMQFDELAKTSSAIGYRAVKKTDDEFDLDLQVLSRRALAYTESGGRFVVILDYDYVRPGTGELHSIEAAEVFRIVHDICPFAELVLVSTSFPKSVTDVGGESYGDFRIEEVYLHAATANRVHNFADISYGDYGSINPIRNDAVARGWRPRIDYPYGPDHVFYYREKRSSHGSGDDKVYSAYATHYKNVAAKVVADSKFRHDSLSFRADIWGVSQIIEASQQPLPKSSPSFWISVRMNIHIHQQIDRLRRASTDLNSLLL